MRRVPIVEVGEPRAEAKPAAASITEPASAPTENNGSEKKSAPKPAPVVLPSVLPSVPTPTIDPASITTAAQFERSWRQLQTSSDKESLYTFFKVVHVCLFMNFIHPSIFITPNLYLSIHVFLFSPLAFLSPVPMPYSSGTRCSLIPGPIAE
jgi:hypothetical protein